MDSLQGSSISLSPLEAQLRECFGRVVYSTKTHEKAADRCLRLLARLKTTQIVLSAITTGGLLTAVLGEPSTSRAASVISTIVATALLALNMYSKSSNPGQLAQEHRDTAVRLWAIRESYLSLLTDLRSTTVRADQIAKKRDQLQVRLAAVYRGAPRTTSAAYGDAGTALKDREELTFSDKEIDAFLPSPLRRAT
jgi:hypothetical protein